MRTSFLLLAALAVATTAACGEVSGFIDAAPGDDDDTIDASTVDAEPEPGAVNVVTHALCCDPPAGPIAGIPIFVVNPDGTLGDTATTGANGQATVDVLPGASVTAVYQRSGGSGSPGATIQTFAAVEPGDTVTFGQNWTEGTSQPVLASVTVNWTAQAGVSYFYLYGACGYHYISGAGTTVTESITESCGAGPTTYYLAAYDTSGNTIRVGSLPSVTHTTQTVTITNFQPGTNFSMSVSGIPPEITGMYLYSTGYYDGTQYVTGYGTFVTPSGGSASFSRTWPTQVIESVYSSIELYRDGPYNSQYQYEWTPGASSRTITNPRLLPWLSQIIYSAPTREILWLQAGDEAYDHALVNAYWSRGSGGSAVFGGSGSEYYDWTLILPPGVTHLQLPEAPAALEPFLPTADDDLDVYVQIGESPRVDSYREVVALPFWEQYAFGPEMPGDLPLVRRSTASTSSGKGRLLPRHGLPHQLEPASRR